MAKPHWSHSYIDGPNEARIPVWGCQHSDCTSKATHQWQRTATAEEVATEAATPGPYGSLVRNAEGPQRVAVFACAEHILSLDAMAQTHDAACPAPDSGCGCDAPNSSHAAARG
jgi:hypothetical protein